MSDTRYYKIQRDFKYHHSSRKSQHWEGGNALSACHAWCPSMVMTHLDSCPATIGGGRRAPTSSHPSKETPPVEEFLDAWLALKLTGLKMFHHVLPKVLSTALTDSNASCATRCDFKRCSIPAKETAWLRSYGCLDNHDWQMISAC